MIRNPSVRRRGGVAVHPHHVRRRATRWRVGRALAWGLVRGAAAASSVAVIGLGAAGGADAAVEHPASDPVQTVAVSFRVRNTNTSRVPCASDGAGYTVRGHLVGPTSQLAGGANRAVTLYYHGLGFGEFFWRFQAVQGYDFSSMLAARGQVSLVVDRLGYGASDKPPGTMSCYGSQADVAHQMVGALRTGAYTAADRAAPRFGKVVLAGHSGSGFTVENEAYSYKDIAGLIIVGFADGGASPLAISNAGQTQMVCTTGGQQVYGNSGPSGYAYFGQTARDFQQGVFDNTDPSVIAAATALRSRDPCGETGSAVSTGAANTAGDGEVTVPVLIVEGDHDAYFPPPAATEQRSLFTGSADVTAITLANTGHALTLGRTAPQFATTIADWLTKRFPPTSTAGDPGTSRGGSMPRRGCPRSNGRLSGRTLGQFRLGQTRAAVRKRFRTSSNRARRYMDFFCLTPNGIRVGYPSPKLLAKLRPRLRRAVQSRAILGLTANPGYALRGVRPGARLAKVARHLRAGRPFHIGLNDWYLVPDGSSTGVLKVRHGVIEEVGIADTATDRWAPSRTSVPDNVLLTRVLGWVASQTRGLGAPRLSNATSTRGPAREPTLSPELSRNAWT